jgi:hypothetical protein
MIRTIIQNLDWWDRRNGLSYRFINNTAFFNPCELKANGYDKAEFQLLHFAWELLLIVLIKELCSSLIPVTCGDEDKWGPTSSV